MYDALGKFAEDEIDWAHREADKIRASKGLAPYFNKGAHMSITKFYCVGCLQDGDRVDAEWKLDGKAYCTPCKDTLVGIGGHGEPVPIQVLDTVKLSNKRFKIPENIRDYIVKSPDKTIATLCEETGVSKQTIYSIRAKAKKEDSSSLPKNTNKDTDPIATVPLMLLLSTAQLDGIWSKLSQSEKAKLLEPKILEYITR